MPKTYKSKTFQALHEAAKRMNETRDCTVKAIAIAGDLSYEDAHCLLELFGRKPRSGTYTYMTRRALKFLDLVTEDRTHYFRARGGKTVRTLGRVMKRYSGTYLVWTASHVLAVKDGEICDWTDGRLHRIKKVERVYHETAASTEGS